MAYTTINKPNTQMNTVLYQSNNSTGQSITGVGFQPDFLWVKDRQAGGAHVLVDVVRGSTKWLGSANTDAEVTRADQVTSFDSDGFTLGADSGNFINYQTNNNVAWNWKAGGTAVSNTAGDITSSVSANTDSGFSIVSYTGNATAGATIGHGLGVKPSMIIVKRRDASESWGVYHKDLTSIDYYLALNATTGEGSATTIWNSTEPTSSLITLGTSTYSNASSGTYVAYCFAEKKGFSKFGSYTGNGSADGTFIYTGFKPAFILAKCSSASGGWVITDIKRNTYNPLSKRLYPDMSDAESTTNNWYDVLSNGFKARLSDGTHNGSGKTYIYMAFAEAPIVGSNNVPANAR